MNIGQLPSEIRLEIFEILPKSTLYQCLFVSRLWQQTAAQLIYKAIRVNDANIDKLQSTLAHDKPNESLKQYGHWTKVLRYVTKPGDTHVKHLTQSSLLLLLSYLPNLKIIDVADSLHFDHYMKVLNNGRDSIQLDSLECIRSKPHNEFGPTIGQDQKLYFFTLHKYKQSLTDISICYNSDSRHFNETNVDILQVLPQFHCLTRLTLSNLVNQHLTIFDLLSICPQLTDLDFTSAYPVPNDLAETQLADLCNKKTMKSLSLCVPVVTPAYIRYITFFTAPDMDTIRLNMTRTNFYNWIDTIGSDTVVQLAQRMSKAHNACIRTNSNPEQRRPQCNVSKMTRFYQILHALMGNRPLQCQGIYTQYKPGEIYISIYQNYFLDFQYSLNYEDFEDGEDNDMRAAYEGLALPDRTISQIGPEIMNSCSFLLIRPMERVPHGLVKYILMHCPYLYYFQVNCTAHYSECLLEAGIPNTNCIKIPKQSTKDQITQLLFKRGVVLWTELSHILAKYLPNIRVCKFIKVQLLAQRGSTNSMIDLSGFKNLEACYFDIAPIVKLIALKYMDHIFVKFEYIDCERVDWFQVQRSTTYNRSRRTCPYTVTVAESEYVQQCLLQHPSKNCVVTYRCSRVPSVFDIVVPLYPILQLSHGQQKSNDV
jgi:hypothetical protein